MQTESAKINNAGEARFRIKAPNSIARSIKVVALDPASENALTLVAQNKWNGASFFTASAFTGSPNSKKFSSDWLKDLAGRTRDLVREIESSDSVIMVGTAGQDLSCGALIGEVCALKHVLTTGLVLAGKDRGGAQLMRALGELRPHVIMLVATNDDAYLHDMLVWLNA